MNRDEVNALMSMMQNMTVSLQKIAIHMEQLVEKMDSIDNNIVYLGHTMEEINTEEIS